MITYYADSTPMGSPLSSLETMKRANEMFGNIVVPIHYALGTHPLHRAGYNRCVTEYNARPTRLIGTHRLFTPHTPLGPIMSASEQSPDITKPTIRAYLSFLSRCQNKIVRDMDYLEEVVVDHPDPFLLKGPLAYGETVTKDCLVQEVLSEVLYELHFSKNYRVCAYGIPFWRSSTGYPWWEQLKDFNSAHSMYNSSSVQPTLEQQKERLAALMNTPEEKCVFFSLLHDRVEDTAYLHKNDNNAEGVSTWILYPQPGTALGTTPWENVERYLELMK